MANRRVLRQRIMCVGCWERRHIPIVIHGPLAAPFRVVGLHPSAMNPNLCTRCETRFKGIMRSAQLKLPLTILFADVRGYTSLSNSPDSPDVSGMLGRFYETCAEVIWDREGIINKLIGDAVLAVFNFPIVRRDHVSRAVEAAVELQRRCAELAATSEGPGGGVIPIGIGIGIHTGETLIGEVGQLMRDFTVIGPVVNLTARLQGAAGPGEILVTEEVYHEAADALAGAEKRTYELKGFELPLTAYVIAAKGPTPKPASAI